MQVMANMFQLCNCFLFFVKTSDRTQSLISNNADINMFCKKIFFFRLAILVTLASEYFTTSQLFWL